MVNMLLRLGSFISVYCHQLFHVKPIFKIMNVVLRVEMTVRFCQRWPLRGFPFYAGCFPNEFIGKLSV